MKQRLDNTFVVTKHPDGILIIVETTIQNTYVYNAYQMGWLRKIELIYDFAKWLMFGNNANAIVEEL